MPRTSPPLQERRRQRRGRGGWRRRRGLEQRWHASSLPDRPGLPLRCPYRPVPYRARTRPEQPRAGPLAVSTTRSLHDGRASPPMIREHGCVRSQPRRPGKSWLRASRTCRSSTPPARRGPTSPACNVVPTGSHRDCDTLVQQVRITLSARVTAAEATPIMQGATYCGRRRDGPDAIRGRLVSVVAPRRNIAASAARR